MSSASEQEWVRQLLQEAEQMLAQALHLSHMAFEEAEALSNCMQLRGDHNYEYEVAPWQLPTDASTDPSEARDDEGKAAALFLDAGRRFERGHDFKRALVCLHDALNYARRVKGPAAREIEGRAAGAIAYTYLTLSELASDEEQTRAANEAAARYYEFEGFLKFQQGDQQASADAYAIARFRYQMASRFEESARAAEKEAVNFQALSNMLRAGEALIMRAEMLFAATKGGRDRRTEAVGALLAAGRLLANVDSERSRAAKILLDASRKALEIFQTNRGSYDPDLQQTVVESLREARILYEQMGEFVKADESHYLASRIRRLRFQSSGRLGWMKPGFLVSLLLDAAWGYGTRPWRLLATASVMVVVFGALYLLVGDVQWANGTTGTVRATRALAALILSVTALLPAQLIERIVRLNLLPVILVDRVGEVLVFLESSVGLALAAMAMFFLSRWIKRRHLPPGDD